MSRLAKAITIGLLTGMVGLMLGLAPVGLDLEEQVGWHILFMLLGERQAPAEVIIVSVDKASATHLNLPNDPAAWPRWQHARLTENLVQAGAAVIAFDIIFDKARTAADDQAFAEAMGRASNVVLL